MSEAIQGNSDTSLAVPIKRKRGRPRKDKSLNRVEGVRQRKVQNRHRWENVNAPPGFSGANGNHQYPVDQVEDPSDGMVGQAVMGVVEAVFDAGYLLAVKIGNSSTALRGVVFKPGHYAPVTPANDVAPLVQMIRRNELLPTQSHTRVRRSRSREKHEQHVGYVGNGSASNELQRFDPLAANSISSKGKSTAIVAAPSVPPVGVRGTVVPVVLEPVNIPIGFQSPNQSSAATQAAHMMALKGKTVQTVTPLSVYDPNESATAHQNVVLTSEAAQTSSHDAAEGVNKEGGQGALESDIQNGSGIGAHKLPSEDSSAVPDQETGDMNEPLFVEPLRTVHTNLLHQPPYVPRLVGNNSIGRMTELLHAVQENLKIPETGLGDETVQSEKKFLPPSV